LAGNNSLELEISSLFQEGNTLDVICAEVISKYEKSDVVSPSEIESISHFLTLAGRIDLLFAFYLKCLRKDSVSSFPWGSFTSACGRLDYFDLEDVIDIIDAALNDKKNYDNAARSKQLVDAIPALNNYLLNQKSEFQNERLKVKTKLISQLNHNRLYQLNEQEEQTLQQLVKLFPQDTEVKLLHQAHLEKKADEILVKARVPVSKRINKRVTDPTNPETDEFITSLRDHLTTLATRLQSEAPDQIYNLTLLAMQFELYDLAIELINMAPRTFASEWLKAEILFEAQRFLDLLKHIEMIERTMSTTPEATYGALYLKAQAYYGLGQRDMAIQLLETLSSKVNSYRSTEALIHEWKNQ
jgi:hypothetical protein